MKPYSLAEGQILLRADDFDPLGEQERVEGVDADDRRLRIRRSDMPDWGHGRRVFWANRRYSKGSRRNHARGKAGGMETWSSAGRCEENGPSVAPNPTYQLSHDHSSALAARRTIRGGFGSAHRTRNGFLESSYPPGPEQAPAVTADALSIEARPGETRSIAPQPQIAKPLYNQPGDPQHPKTRKERHNEFHAHHP